MCFGVCDSELGDWWIVGEQLIYLYRKIAWRGDFLLDYWLGEEGGGDEASFFAFGFVGVVEDADGPVDDSKGEGADDEADDGVENGIFGFFQLAWVALGGHVVYAADDDKDDGDDAHDGDDGV